MNPEASTWLGVPVTALIPTALAALGTIFAALIALSAPTLTFWWTSVRHAAKKAAAIEFATKRLALWEQFLRVGLDAAGADQARQDQARQRAYQGIGKVLSDADGQMVVLSWKQKRDESIKQQIANGGWKFMLAVKPHYPLSWVDRITWWQYILINWFFLLLGVVLILRILWIQVTHFPPRAFPRYYWVYFVLLMVCSYTARSARIQAEKLNFKRPAEPIIDQL